LFYLFKSDHKDPYETHIHDVYTYKAKTNGNATITTYKQNNETIEKLQSSASINCSKLLIIISKSRKCRICWFRT